jgi:hypothetical protein
MGRLVDTCHFWKVLIVYEQLWKDYNSNSCLKIWQWRKNIWPRYNTIRSSLSAMSYRLVSNLWTCHHSGYQWIFCRSPLRSLFSNKRKLCYLGLFQARPRASNLRSCSGFLQLVRSARALNLRYTGSVPPIIYNTLWGKFADLRHLGWILLIQ